MPYEYTIALGPTSLAGTVAVTGTNAVTGTGTEFLTNVFPGDVVGINGEWHTVESVASDTTLAIVTTWAQSVSGETLDLYSLHFKLNEFTAEVPFPKGVFLPYSTPLDLGSGALRGAGWAAAEWRWGYLTQAQRDELREYFSAVTASELLVIRTTTNEDADAYGNFFAQAIWPQAEDRDAGRRKSFTLRFRALVEII